MSCAERHVGTPASGTHGTDVVRQAVHKKKLEGTLMHHAGRAAILTTLSRGLLLVLAMAGVDAAPLSATHMTIRAGLADYQVFQRDTSGAATIRFSAVLSERQSGKVECRVIAQRSGAVAADWHEVGTCRGGQVQATLARLITGGPYAVQVRVVASNGGVIAEKEVRHILVGDLWVLAGQSNMQGIGELRDAPEPSILVNSYGFDEQWSFAADPLHWLLDSPDPVHHGGRAPEELARARAAAKRDPQTGVGLALPFAKELVARTGVPIGLVPCAHGGTAMEQWDPAKRDQGGISLYGSMFRRFLAVGGRVRGVLWYQGESDANQSQAPLFHDRFLALVAAIRRDFGDPQLPFYFVQLGRYVAAHENPYWNVIREQQRLCAVELPHAGMVTAIDLPLDDPIHISSKGHERLGRRLARLVLRDLFGHSEIQPGPTLADIAIIPFRFPRYRLTFAGVNGRLCSPPVPSGFSIRDSQGQDLRLIYKVELAATEPCIDLYLRQASPPDAQLWYGWGLDPHCTVTDELDMGLPAFGPVNLNQVALQSFIQRAQVSPRDVSLATLLPQVVGLASDQRATLLPLVQEMLAAFPAEERFTRLPFLFALGDLSEWRTYVERARSASLATRKELARTWSTSAHFPALSCKFITKWQVVGPFDNSDDKGFDRPFGPERSGVTTASYADGLGGAVTWQQAEADREGFLDLTGCFAVKENAIAYARAEVHASQEVDTILLVGSDDGVAVWLNGRLVHAEHRHRAASPAQDLVVVHLDKGSNIILAKVEQVAGDWGLYLQLVDPVSTLSYD